VIDDDNLLADGRINGEEYIRLKDMSVEETGSLGFNILIDFGVIATADGALALLPDWRLLQLRSQSSTTNNMR
jgi:hypothetical protein